MLFLICLLICIIIHEAGHLIAAKICGCKVLTFSVGFGKALIKKEIKGTTYQIAAIPFGGYCSLEDELTSTDSKTGFANLSYSKKFIIIVAGCAINILFGIISSWLGTIWANYYLLYFGFISVSLGITNLIPLAPCLDGGYLFYLPICLKIWGKEKGFQIFAKTSKISFYILMGINVACIHIYFI